MARVILERSFEPPLTDDERRRLEGRLAPCLARHGAHWVRSHLSLDRRRMVCEFEAPDAETIRMASRTAKLPYDRVWTARVLEAPPVSAHGPGGAGP